MSKVVRYVVGVAPAQTSTTINDGELAAWCPSAKCGERIRKLFPEGPDNRFLNASNVRPEQWTNKNGRKVDVSPSTTLGFELVCRLADTQPTQDPITLLVLGHQYWRRALNQAVQKGRIEVEQRTLRIASPMPLLDAQGNEVGHVTLVAHPSRWPEVRTKSRGVAKSAVEYRDWVVAGLVQQGHRSGGKGSSLVTREDYISVFEQFMAGC